MTTPIPVADMPTVAEIALAPLTLQDRCDRCHAQAFVRAAILVHDTGTMVDLMFCHHHFKQHEAKITAVAMHIQDESDRINKNASASSA